MAESFGSKFRPMSHHKPKCLFPVANVPVMLYTVEFLASNGVTDVIIVSSREKSVFEPLIRTVRESRPLPKDMTVRSVTLHNPTSMAQALKDLNEMCDIKDNFILIQGDIISNASLGPAIKMHFEGVKKRDKENQPTPTIVTKVLAGIPFSNPIRDPSQEIMVMFDSETRQILDYFQFCNKERESEREGEERAQASALQRSYKINRKHVVLKRQARQYELRHDLIDTEIAICHKTVFTHIQEDIELKQFKEDFIINLLTSELTDDQVQGYILPSEAYYGKLNDPRTYQVLTQDVIQRKSAPFVVEFPVFKGNVDVYPHHKYLGKDIQKHASSVISDFCVIGARTEIGENTTIINSVIGEDCFIENSCEITNCIIWDGAQIKSGSVLKNALICENVVLNCDCVVSDGVMLDKDVEVADGVTLEKNLLASCYEIGFDSKGNVSFKKQDVEKGDEELFERGQVCFMPMDLKLEPYQYLGQQTPYANEEESDIEESDDEEFFEGVSNSQFRDFVKSQVKQILQSQYTMECALVDIKRMKHTYSKGDQLCQAAIYPTVLEVLYDKITDGMKQKDKLEKIKETLSFFKQMLKIFVNSEDDQANVIYLVALFCSKNANVSDCFHLFIQLLHDSEYAVLETKPIVDWIDSTKEKIKVGA